MGVACEAPDSGITVKRKSLVMRVNEDPLNQGMSSDSSERGTLWHMA
jgi:hypothetical protein